jgi:hypothetical protein
MFGMSSLHSKSSIMKSVKNIVPAVLLLVSGICVLSCKKEKGHLYFREIRATAVLGSGEVINFNVNQPPQANLGVDPYVGYPYISVTNEYNSKIYMSVADISGLGGPNQAGTYPSGSYRYVCHFILNNLATPGEEYSNTPYNPGSITFTRFETNYMEGNFFAYCKLGTDSVLVSGTFKGEF